MSTVSGKQEAVFDLIQSMSKAEKRNFKLYATRLSGNQEAKFVSLFYLFYTVARLVTGFLVDFLGDIVSMAVFSFVLIALYVVGFLMGKSGVMVLAASGLLISPLYPTAITVPMQVFGEKAKNTISVILCIACLVNLVIQVLIGYVNQCVGAAWGYRSMSIAMCILIILCMGITYLRLKHSSR